MWQPIETAPKDGTEIWVFGLFAGEVLGANGRKTVAHVRWTSRTDYAGYNWRVCNTDASEAWINATHWQPLPEPPK